MRALALAYASSRSLIETVDLLDSSALEEEDERPPQTVAGRGGHRLRTLMGLAAGAGAGAGTGASSSSTSSCCMRSMKRNVGLCWFWSK